MDDRRHAAINKSLAEQAVNFLSCGALAAQAWDLMMSFSDEVEYLWRGKFTFIKALYFGSRYGMLVTQVINQLLSFPFEEDSYLFLICSEIFIFKAILAQLGLTLVEMILLIRVYALYNQSFRAKWLLTSVFVISTTLETTGNSLVIQALARTSRCIPPILDRKALMIFGIGAGVCQSIVFIMTIAKLVAGQQRRTPLTSLMLKEGVVTFLLVFALVAIMIAYEIIRNIDMGVGNAAFSWYTALLSVTGSRLILNMRKVAVMHRMQRHITTDDEAYSGDESVCLTSVHE